MFKNRRRTAFLFVLQFFAVAGNWQLAEPVPGVTVNTRNGETQICGTFRHGIAKQLKLKKVQAD